MIGPGTGIAPMRAILQERKYQGRAQKFSGAGKNTLYFGCKYSKIDYIYR
jgi:NADPH-ferrihemoprotein reductase